MSKLKLLMYLSLIFLFSCSKETRQEVLKIQSFFGNVTVQVQNTTRVPEIGQILSLNDVVMTGKGAIVDLIYRDAGIIRINENTTVKIESLMKEKNDDVVLTIDTGKTFATLGKLKKGDNFALKSKTVIAAVRGTSFRMVAKKEGASVDVVTGKVMVKPLSNNTVVEDVEVVVEENQTVAVDTKTVETIVQKIEQSKDEKIEKNEQQKIAEEVKEALKPVETSEETIKEIKQEVKDIPVVAEVHEEVKQELHKVLEDEDAQKREEEKLKKEQAEKERQQKALELKLKKEQLAKAKKEKEEREKVEKEKKIKEDRVKNIPTL